MNCSAPSSGDSRRQRSFGASAVPASLAGSKSRCIYSQGCYNVENAEVASRWLVARANTSRSEYGCSLHAQRGDAVCKNDLRIQRKQLEESLLTGLQDKVLREEFIDYVICGLKEELKQKHEELELWKKTLQAEAERIELELKHLIEAIAAGNSSPTVMAAISEREARLREIRDQAIKPGPGSFQEKLDDLRDFAIARLNHLKELLTNPKAIHEARALLAEQVGKFTLERVEENGALSFRANGNIDLFGEEAFTRVGGAGGPDRTMVPLAQAC